MRKFITSFVTFLLGAVLLTFMIANRQPVRLGLDPFNTENPAVALPFAMPLWAALFATLFLGYFLGAFGMWLSGRKSREKARAVKRALRQTKEELALALAAREQAEQKVPAEKTPAPGDDDNRP